jgi:hypothetical protein
MGTSFLDEHPAATKATATIKIMIFFMGVSLIMKEILLNHIGR